MKRIAFVLIAVLAFTTSNFAEQLTPAQLASLVASARTSADHARIANFYRAEADKLFAESQDHARMAAAFRGNVATNNNKRAQGTINHCDYLAKSLKARSQKARALADEHDRMTKAAGLD